MFNLFGKKTATATAIPGMFKDDAYALRHEIHRIQEELATVLESKGRATKDERAILVTSSLDAFKKVDTFLTKYTK